MSVGHEPRSRTSGVLLHPTSLPGGVIGDLGEDALRFVDWLGRAGQTYWQILPLVPVDAGGSPYNGLSALAGNPLLISPEILVRDGLVTREAAEAPAGPATGVDRVSYSEAVRWKAALLRSAHRQYRSDPGELRAEFVDYQERNDRWLLDFAHFMALRALHREACWADWPREVRDRQPEALERSRQLLADEIDRYAFEQFLFERQWGALRARAAERGIRIIGDIPIFVAYDSADVWANREIFQLDEDGRPLVVSGVPPDYFSATGQRWGNPLYRWDVMKDQGYAWWMERFRRTLEMVDVVRIDHFRGFESYWEIDVEEATAVHGRWRAGPGAAFFRHLERHLGELPVIAEDLGLITREVEELRDSLELPGMRVLQFAFDGDPGNPHLPANHPVTAVAYTGTHDNDTIMGWWEGCEREERRRVAEWLGTAHPSQWNFIESVFASPAATAIVPMQDVLGLGREGRMNTPGDVTANWSWRLREQPGGDVADHLRSATMRAGRARVETARTRPHIDAERNG